MFEPSRIIQELAQSPSLQMLRRQIDPEQVIRSAIAIQQIASPTFEESQRAAYLKERFQAGGLSDVQMDALYNVYGRWPGTSATHSGLMVSAHTDTVFPADTDLAVRRGQDHITGPGLGDNSLGVAALLTLVDLITSSQIQPAADIWFVANTREEGLGNLDGIRAMWRTLGARLGAAVVIEGMALGHIYHAGIAVRRLHVYCKAPGGHSWLHYGKPSAVHGLVDVCARILKLSPPSNPRTTYNIGMINGGHSINSLAMDAEMFLDLRSESADVLAEFEQQVRETVEAAQGPGLDFTIDVVGDRPSGQIPVSHSLVQLAAAALRAIEHEPQYEMGSTDANVLLANGLPSVTVGVTYGGNAHRMDEYIETKPVALGIWQLVLLVLAAADHAHSWQVES
jgi:tripeptide aminopeptidase